MNTICKKKIYFVAETIINGETIQSEPFNQILRPDGQLVFEDVFQITEFAEIENYSNIEDFVGILNLVSRNYFSEYGDVDGDISVVAISEESDIFQWGITMTPINADDSFDYYLMDWKSNGIFKFCK